MDWYSKLILRIETAYKVRRLVDSCSRFKIGKTGQELFSRFDSKYKEQYDRIKEVCSSTNKKVIDDLEKFLIKHYQKKAKYSSRCDNEAYGKGDMGESATYYVYVVVKD